MKLEYCGVETTDTNEVIVLPDDNFNNSRQSTIIDENLSYLS